MEKSTRPDRRSPLRTIVFALLAAVVLFGLVLGRFPPPMLRERAQMATLYGRAGDAFMQMVYLAQGPGREETEGREFLQKALDYYWLSVEADPTDPTIMTSFALVLHELGKTEDAKLVFGSLAQRAASPEEQKPIVATFLVVSSTPPAPRQVEAAAEFLRGIAPGRLALARAYDSLGQPELAQHEWEAAERDAERVLRAVFVLLLIGAAMTGVGLAGLIVALVARVRRARVTPAEEGEPAPAAAWGVREAVEALILWVFVATILGALTDDRTMGGRQHGLAFSLLPELCAALVAIAWVLIASPRPTRLGWRLAGGWRQVLVGLCAAGAVALPVLVLYQSIQQIYVRYMFSHQTVPGDLPQGHPMAPVFVIASGWPAKLLAAGAACVIMPALEETLFRGILFRGLRKEWSFGPGALASALVFAVAHLNPTAVVPYLVLGLVFAYLYERSGSLVAPWVAHGAFNGFNIAILMAIAG